jgi:putative ATPase
MNMAPQTEAPLAERMRPRTLDDYVGQSHLVGQDATLRRAMAAGQLPSMILWGPPGVGKTTLARLMAEATGRPFHQLSAIRSGVKEVRGVIDSAERQGMFSTRAVLFIDEIHRFSKSQQDSLLGAVERGSVTLIGATTENPSFEVIPALLSRSQVYVLEAFGRSELEALVHRALAKDEWLQHHRVEVLEWDALLRASGGDGRRLLNVLELVVAGAASEREDQPEASKEGVKLDDVLVGRFIQANLSRYDKTGDTHYDIASALIKSIRSSDPDAAVYWLARMIEGGEDPKFIARRLLISASEDIGHANPTALVLANATFDAVERLGIPECRIPLSQCATYLASSPKSNSAYAAIGAAQQAVQQHGDLPVPMHLRNAPTKLMKELGHGSGYQYDHDHGGFSGQEGLPEALSGRRFFKLGSTPRERGLAEFLQSLWGGKKG